MGTPSALRRIVILAVVGVVVAAGVLAWLLLRGDDADARLGTQVGDVYRAQSGARVGLHATCATISSAAGRCRLLDADDREQAHFRIFIDDRGAWRTETFTPPGGASGADPTSGLVLTGCCVEGGRGGDATF